MRISAVELAKLLGLPVPTDEQAAVIESPLGPGVVIAGAGSGKTETMAARVVWLVANRQVAPEAVLGLTFTRKAAAELGKRIRRRLAQWRGVVAREAPDDTEQLAQLTAGEPTVSTYAAYSGRLLADHAMRIGAEPSARLLTEAVRWQLADAVVRRHTGELPEDIGAISTLPRYVLELAGDFADHLVSATDVDSLCRSLLAGFWALPLGPRVRSETPKGTDVLVRSLEHRRELLPLVAAFEEAKSRLNAVDFGDQTVLAARLAGLPEVGEAERAKYHAVLLDEYQDTGHAQVALLSGLFGGGHPVTAVGDPFQSIYGWRGASAGNIARFATTFPTATGPAPVFPLATSWRNERVILRAANAVAAPLRAITAGTVELRPSDLAGDGAIRAAVLETSADEARWVAGHLAEQWAALPTGNRTAAVLVRRRSQIPELAIALGEAGLPVEIVGLGGLLTTPEVVDVVSTLRVLADHKGSTALMRLLTGARWRIGPADLAALGERARRLARPNRPEGAVLGDASADAASLVEAVDDPGQAHAYSADGHARISRLGAELRHLRRFTGAPLPDLVAEVERVIGVHVEVGARPDRQVMGRTHLDRFLDEAARFAAESDHATLTAFLAFLEAAEKEEHGLDAGEISVEAERVQVLTVHGAKGLEWDVVAVPGLVSDVFPAEPRQLDWTRTRHLLPAPLRGDRADLPTFTLAGAEHRVEVGDRLARHNEDVKERHLAEERRLAYVALTRAKSVLLASAYAWDTAVKPRSVSVFLEEIRPFAEVEQWFVPEPDATNPVTATPVSGPWPIEPLGQRRAAVEEGAELVRAALAAPAVAPPKPRARKQFEPLPGLIDDTTDRAAAWRRDVDLLLAERAAMARGGTIDVTLPDHLSVSQLVSLRRDPDDLARRLRRPVPARPAPLARRGTRFHTWLEQRWGQQALLDLDELPGAADEGADDAEFEALRAAFEASAWAHRDPVEVEVPFEMAVGGTVVRGRMDAVFAGVIDDPAAEGWTVVDWKTGARPSGAEAEHAAVQLAAYRLAWARIAGVPDDELHRVRAAFHYVKTNETVSPAGLAGAEELVSLVVG